MSLNRALIDEATKALIIQDVYFRDELVSVASDVTPKFLPEVGKSQFRMTTRILHDFQAEVTNKKNEDALQRYLEIEFSGFVRCLAAPLENEEGEPAELLKMQVSLGLLYLVRNICSEEAIEEFVRMNAPLHAIPYWREHVHSVCTKRRFPLVTVPMYHRVMGRKEPQVAHDSLRENAEEKESTPERPSHTEE